MTTSTEYSRSLAALGHDARLAIYRLLMKSGESGLPVGEIGDRLELAPSTLAHHLSTLVDAKLVLQAKRGREVFNMVDHDATLRLVNFLTSECCTGVAMLTQEDAA